MDRIESEQRYFLDDGRRAEKRITDDGETRITEIYEEVDVPKKITRRMIEKLKPVVCERTVETLDENGVVIESKTKTVRPKPLVESSLTKEDVSVIVAEAIAAVVDLVKDEEIDSTVTSFSAGAIIKERLQPDKKTKILDWALWGIIAIEVVVLGYLLWPTILKLAQ